MRKIFFQLIIAIGTILIIGSCSVQKNAIDLSVKKSSEKELYQKINSFDRKSDYLIIKGAKISIDDNSVLTNLKANFIIAKDSAIMVSVSNPLGIEITRAILMPDSIKVIDRLNKTYVEAKFKELERKFSVALDFYQIQSILTGDYKNTFSINKENSNNEIISENGIFKLVIPYSVENGNRIEEVLFINQNTNCVQNQPF